MCLTLEAFFAKDFLFVSFRLATAPFFHLLNPLIDFGKFPFCSSYVPKFLNISFLYKKNTIKLKPTISSIIDFKQLRIGRISKNKLNLKYIFTWPNLWIFGPT